MRENVWVSYKELEGTKEQFRYKWEDNIVKLRQRKAMIRIPTIDLVLLAESVSEAMAKKYKKKIAKKGKVKRRIKR